MNPMEIWNAYKRENKQNADVELQKAETRAQELANAQADREALDEGDDDGNVITTTSARDVEGHDDYDEQDGLQEALKDMSRSKSERKRTKYVPNQTRRRKTDLQHIINAVTAMKAAANYMLEQKIGRGLVQHVQQTFQQLDGQMFRRKWVTNADIEYYEAHRDIDTVLSNVNDAIKSSPKFQWVPELTLSAVQLKEKERRTDEAEQEYIKYSTMLKDTLSRSKEYTDGQPIVEGVTTMFDVQKREKKEQKSKEKIAKTKAPIIKSKKAQKKDERTARIKELQKKVDELEELHGSKRRPVTSKNISRRQRQRSVVDDSPSSSDNSEYCPSIAAFSRQSEPMMYFQEGKADDSNSDAENPSDESDSDVEIPNDDRSTIDEKVISTANKLIRVLKTAANSWDSTSGFLQQRKRTESDTKETFISMIKIAVIDEFESCFYKDMYLPMLVVFGVSLEHEDMENSFKTRSQRIQYLNHLVDAIILSKCNNSTSSSRIDITANVIKESLLQFKLF
jgi:hypothetical protein